MSGGYARASNNLSIRLDDGAGALAALSYEASVRLRKKAWAHLRRINKLAARKAQQIAKTR